MDMEALISRVRLCEDCNKGIGFLKDSPAILMSAARYLGVGVI